MSEFKVGDFVEHKYGFYGRIYSIDDKGYLHLFTPYRKHGKTYQAFAEFCINLNWSDEEKMLWILENE